MILRWTESALLDLHAIEAYIGLRSSRYARSFVERVVSRAEILVSQPFSGVSVPEFDDPAIREVLVVPYRNIYRVLPAEVQVIAVVHGARNLPPIG